MKVNKNYESYCHSSFIRLKLILLAESITVDLVVQYVYKQSFSAGQTTASKVPLLQYRTSKVYLTFKCLEII
jgi:hypothetical protein